MIRVFGASMAGQGADMVPGSFIFRRLSDEWWAGRTAFWLFGLASLIILATSPIVFDWTSAADTSTLAGVLLGLLGCACVLSVFFLWAGMWHYWARFDSSSQAARRLWFVVLLGGLWYGAILYFLFVCLRGRKNTRSRAAGGQSEPGLFGYSLLAGWCALFVAVALSFAFPQGMSRLLHPLAGTLVVVPAALLIASAVYGLMRLCRRGTKHSAL